jgi:hypothetical protein
MDSHPNEKWAPPTAPKANVSTGSRPKPNFSGEYVLQRDASKLEGGAATTRGAILRIDHHEPMIRIDAKFEFVGQTFAFSTQRTSDGRERPEPSDPRNVSSLRWDGDGPLFTDKSDTLKGPVTMTWCYELVDNGRRLKATEQIRGGGRDQDNVWVFERR